MTEREFCYWLQGLFEVGKPDTLNAEQTEMIRKHLELVFTNVTKTPISIPTVFPMPSVPGTTADGPLDWLRRQAQCTAISAPNSAARSYC